MERGIYAQGWYARQHNYHPSRPARRLRMIDEFEAYRGTLLTWPALGGGGISLPYLEGEADGEVPPRFRFYGYVTDREFNAACSARGIKAFGVIFSMQGWEFPVELSEDEDEVLALNELRGVGRRAWLGLREFTQNRYPKLWGSFESYFPDGLRTSDGRPVEDLWEAGCSRDVHGRALRAHWVESPDREHVCHLMDTNNPVWREYLKAVVRIQVDAGVDGIQFDESDGPTGALQYGGCFCDDCMRGFTAYLRTLAPGDVPDDVADDLGPQFHYGRWLLERGLDGIPAAEPDFLARAYVTYARAANAANFHELIEYARRYAAGQGRSLLISSNLFDGAPWLDPLVADVDILVPEQRHTLFRQPAWMRYVAAFGGHKPVTVSFNPYGGILPGLVERLDEGRDVDRFRVMLYEAAALGVNMSVPYGAWMGSVIEDAMYPPHRATRQIQDFLADHEDLYSTSTANDTAVVYGMDANLHHEALWHTTLDAHGAPYADPEVRGSAFFSVADVVARAGQPFDVVIFHDGVLREDDADAQSLARYRHVLLPDLRVLTDRQADALRGYLDGGGRLTVVGDLAPGAADLLDHPGTRTAATAAGLLEGHAPQVVVQGPGDHAVNLQRTATGVALHLVSYDYDEPAGRTPTHEHVTVRVTLPGTGSGIGSGTKTGTGTAVTTARVHVPGHDAQDVPVTTTGTTHTFTVPALTTYAVAELLG